jgi:peptide/nickel transport system permease protein
MNISRYILRRLALLLLVLFGMSLVTFLVARVIPSDPALTYVGGLARPAQVAAARKTLGLDKPLYVQYGIYVRDLVTGDWGDSLLTKRPVISDLLHFLPVSLQLVLPAMLIAVLLGVPLGVLCARWKGGALDQVGRIVSVIGVSFPSFAIAIILQIIFCRVLKLLPPGSTMSVETGILNPITRITGMPLLDALATGNFSAFWDVLKHTILPVLAIAAYPTGTITRMTRSMMLETLSLDYVRMTKAMGIPMRWIVSKFALKNALGPVATVLGLMFAFSLINAFFVELIFSYAGLGLYAVNAIVNLDYPVIVGVTLLVATMYVLANLVVDLIQAWLDPRVVLG